MTEHGATKGRSFARKQFVLGLGVVSLTLLAACEEREFILPGAREDVSSVLTQSDTDAPEATADAARGIQLPGQVANADAAQSFGTQAFRTDHPSLGKPLRQIFAVDIGEGDSRKHRIVADPVVSGGRIFTLDAQTTVTAVSTSGAVLWQRDVLPDGAEEGDATGGGLAADGNVVYVSTGFGALTALDATTGNIIWVQDLEATGSGRPTVFGDLIYIMAGDDTGWALSKSDGRLAWQVTGSDSPTNVLGAPAPVVVAGLTVFSFGSGEMQAVFSKGGLRRWDASVLGERKGRALSKYDDVTGRPIAVGNVIYAGNQSGRTVAVNARSGARIWTANEGAVDTVLPVGGSVFLVSDRNELLRLDASNGARIWGTSLPGFVDVKQGRQAEVYAQHGPILAGGRLIVASSDGLMRSFDPVSGTLVEATEVPNGASTAPVVAGQTLYLVDRKGQLVAYR
ncbi:MAG: PQQ-binding-like beta-propeller repeat protein [Tateyamaria sp.]|uniref:PQQ-like beta-propeller repeat protein n=1 Tax=Tateyamaria sp. TaxID=1929288 RepID=UPI00329C4583